MAPVLTREERERRRQELRDRLLDAACGAPSRLRRLLSAPPPDRKGVNDMKRRREEARERPRARAAAEPAKPREEKPAVIPIDEETRALLEGDASRARYVSPEAAKEAARLGARIGWWRGELLRASREGDEDRFGKARRKLEQLIAERRALREEPEADNEPAATLTQAAVITVPEAPVTGELPAETVTAAGVQVLTTIDGAAAKDLFGEPEQPGQPARAPARAVRLAISGVWDGATLRDLLHGLAQTVGAEGTEGIDWRAEVEITPEEEAS